MLNEDVDEVSTSGRKRSLSQNRISEQVRSQVRLNEQVKEQNHASVIVSVGKNGLNQ